MKQARLILILYYPIYEFLFLSFGWSRGWVHNKTIRYNNKKLVLFKVVLSYSIG